MIDLPALVGHEQAGTVVESGDGVTEFSSATASSRSILAPCGQCFFCLRGQENSVIHLILPNGAYAEFIKIPARIVARKHARHS